MRKKMGAKIVAFGLSAVMLLGLTACSGSADSSNADNGEGSENELHEITLQVGSDSALAGLEEVCKLAESEIGIKVDIEYGCRNGHRQPYKNPIIYGRSCRCAGIFPGSTAHDAESIRAFY